MVQGELFTEESPEASSGQISSFFSKNQLVIGFDKVILLSIVFLVLFILTYSFGYERGYKGAEKKIQAMTAHIETLIPESAPMNVNDAAGNEQTTLQGSTEVAGVPASSNLDNEPADTHEETESRQVSGQGKYTIQIKTVLSKEVAEKEIAKLSAKTGALKPFFIKRGKFFEVCAGSFESVANAKPVINDFKTKKISSDAFVRPLV